MGGSAGFPRIRNLKEQSGTTLTQQTPPLLGTPERAKVGLMLDDMVQAAPRHLLLVAGTGRASGTSFSA